MKSRTTTGWRQWPKRAFRNDVQPVNESCEGTARNSCAQISGGIRMYLREECEKTTSTTLRFFARARQPLAPLAHPTSRSALGEAALFCSLAHQSRASLRRIPSLRWKRREENSEGRLTVGKGDELCCARGGLPITYSCTVLPPPRIVSRPHRLGNYQD